MKRITKGIRAAIDQQKQLFWTGRRDSWLWELSVVTAINENGTERTRRLTTCDNDRDVLALSVEIAALGGKIDLQKIAAQVERRQEEWQKTIDELLGRPTRPGVTALC